MFCFHFFFHQECATGFHFFEKIQDLPTRAAADVQHFTIDGSLFLTFANYYGDINKRKTSSMIYKMNESTGRFTLYQTLQTRGAYGLEYFPIADKHFLAVANFYDGTFSRSKSIKQARERISYTLSHNLFNISSLLFSEERE